METPESDWKVVQMACYTCAPADTQAGCGTNAFRCFSLCYPVWIFAMNKDIHNNIRTIPVPEPLQGLIRLALDSGADEACLVPAHNLVIQDDLVQFCGPNKPCPSYGLSPGCPPHAMSPAAFRLLISRCNWVLLFKLNAAMEILLGPQRQNIARQVHHICAVVENTASKTLGLSAHGFAAGSCKELFCSNASTCTVLTHGLPCPHMQIARPSLSAVGVDFQALAALAGWPYALNGVFDPESGQMQGLMAGFVLMENSTSGS